MKKIVFFLLLLVSSLCAAPFQDHRIDPKAFSELLSFMGIPEDKALERTQKEWRRKAGSELWEIAELSKEKREFVLNWARIQGVFDAWSPSQKTYDKALILGATTGRMTLRLQTLVKAWQKGVGFKEVVWLLGERPLDPRVDSFTDKCKTEAEAARWIWQHADIPEELKALPVRFVAVPMKGDQRPTTPDTIFAWLEVAPKEGCSCLFVSDQPFCGYQFATIKGILPDKYPFDLIGKGVQEDLKNYPTAGAVVLDALAKWYYQERIHPSAPSGL